MPRRLKAREDAADSLNMSMQREPFGAWLRRELLRTAIGLASAAAVAYVSYLALTAALDQII